MVAAKEMDESLFHAKVRHASKARCRYTMDRRPGVIRRENKSGSRRFVHVGSWRSQTPWPNLKNKVRLRTEANRRDALTLEKADTKSYQIR